MHIGGASAKVIVRGELPSAAGHGVAPVIVAPGTVLGWKTVVVLAAIEVALPSTVVVVEDESPSPRLTSNEMA